MASFLDQFRTPSGIDEDALRVAFDAMAKSERRRVTKAVDKEIASLERGLEPLRKKIKRLDSKLAIYNAVQPLLLEWLTSPLILESPSGSLLHQLRQALATDTALFSGADQDYPVSDFDPVLREANCFVVEHNWAKAFEGAGDFAQGEIRLPYDSCVFEFKVSSVRIVALMTTIDETVVMQLFIRVKDQWLIDDEIAQHINGRWELYHAGRCQEKNVLRRIVEFVGGQVRAICVALDAEVAESATIRAEGKFIRAREKAGKVPPQDYRIVSLARRSRPTPLERTECQHEHGKCRLHFRRGHWRHFETFKTWIRWTLVGNPDLGFVDKEYRL